MTIFTYLEKSGEVLMSWIVSSNDFAAAEVVAADVVRSLTDTERCRDESKRGLDVATGWIPAVAFEGPGDEMDSLSLRMGRGLVGWAMTGGGMRGAERGVRSGVGSEPVENFRTSDGLSRPVFPFCCPGLDSFQLRRWTDGLVVGVVDPPPPFSTEAEPLVIIP